MANPFALLSLIIAIPFFGMLFVLTSKDEKGRNAFNVCVFSLLANVVMIFRIFMLINEESRSLQLIERFDWLSTPKISIVLGVDTFSLILILAVHLAILIGLVGVRNNCFKQKTLMVFTLLFLSMITGFFVAADIFSFYIFFEGMLLPLFMIIGIFGMVKKQNTVFRFFLYNFGGALILFAAAVLIYQKCGSVMLRELPGIKLPQPLSYYVWGAIFVSFLSRIPIWPFHYWISSITAGIRNPLAFIVTALMPLTALYGFIRFLPSHFSMSVDVWVIWINIIGVITMLFIALIGFINKEYQYKIFAYTTVYYIMYMTGIFMRDELILLNIGYSLFGFILIVASLEVLSGYISEKESEYNILGYGFLCRVPKLSFVYSFFILAALGMPLSAVFVNNFLILSKLLSSNIKLGMVLMGALALVGAALLQEMYKYKIDNSECPVRRKDDISVSCFVFMLAIVFISIMSFIKPLWFVIDE